MRQQLLPILVTVASVAVLLTRQHSLRGTTLIAPWWWALGSLVSLNCVELLLATGVLSVGNAAAWRFLAASSTLCPSMALLGAKRPQDRSWQWIVASLWLVLTLPAIQHLVLYRSGMLELHSARAWFMLLLLMFGIANSVVSRYWPAILLFGAGQASLLFPYLPFSIPWLPAKTSAGGISLVAAAVLATQVQFRSRLKANALDRVWLDFRSAFGLVWSLRFMERINDVAHTNGWNVTLRWTGFQSSDGSSDWRLPPDQWRVLRQSMANLLRRFVSAEWIDVRLDRGFADLDGLH